MEKTQNSRIPHTLTYQSNYDFGQIKNFFTDVFKKGILIKNIPLEILLDCVRDTKTDQEYFDYVANAILRLCIDQNEANKNGVLHRLLMEIAEKYPLLVFSFVNALVENCIVEEKDFDVLEPIIFLIFEFNAEREESRFMLITTLIKTCFEQEIDANQIMFILFCIVSRVLKEPEFVETLIYCSTQIFITNKQIPDIIGLIKNIQKLFSEQKEICNEVIYYIICGYVKACLMKSRDVNELRTWFDIFIKDLDICKDSMYAIITTLVDFFYNKKYRNTFAPLLVLIKRESTINTIVIGQAISYIMNKFIENATDVDEALNFIKFTINSLYDTYNTYDQLSLENLTAILSIIISETRNGKKITRFLPDGRKKRYPLLLFYIIPDFTKFCHEKQLNFKNIVQGIFDIIKTIKKDHSGEIQDKTDFLASELFFETLCELRINPEIVVKGIYKHIYNLSYYPDFVLNIFEGFLRTYCDDAENTNLWLCNFYFWDAARDNPVVVSAMVQTFLHILVDIKKTEKYIVAQGFVDFVKNLKESCGRNVEKMQLGIFNVIGGFTNFFAPKIASGECRESEFRLMIDVIIEKSDLESPSSSSFPNRRIIESIEYIVDEVFKKFSDSYERQSEHELSTQYETTSN